MLKNMGTADHSEMISMAKSNQYSILLVDEEGMVAPTITTWIIKNHAFFTPASFTFIETQFQTMSADLEEKKPDIVLLVLNPLHKEKWADFIARTQESALVFLLVKNNRLDEAAQMVGQLNVLDVDELNPNLFFQLLISRAENRQLALAANQANQVNLRLLRLMGNETMGKAAVKSAALDARKRCVRSQ